jgi:hypothetical protein
MGAFALMQPMIVGLLQGLKRFQHLGGLSIASVLFKAIALTVVFFMGGSVFWILAAILASITATFLLSTILLYRSLPVSPSKAATLIPAHNVGAFFQISTSSFLFDSIGSVDLLFLQVRSSAYVLGMYALLGNMAKYATQVGTVIASVAFPLSVEQRILGRSSRSLLIRSIALTIGIHVPILVLFVGFGGFFLMHILGKTDVVSIYTFVLFGGSMLICRICEILFSFLVAQFRFVMLPLLLVLLLESFLFLQSEPSIVQYAWALAITMGVLFVLLTAAVLRNTIRR